MALIRYPGSKEKLAHDLWRLFPSEMKHQLWASASQWEYREPFFGAGAIGFKILRNLDSRSRIWINDIDSDLVCLWQSVHREPKKLARCVTDFVPTTEAFYDFKARDGRDDCDHVTRGLRKLALHRMSVSGFGVKSGGPIGGRHQESKQYTVECRWNPERIKRDIFRLNKLMMKFSDMRITCGDFGDMVETADANTFVYLDPPYFEKGGQLYKHNLLPVDHRRLAGCVRRCAAHWVLSYDDHPVVRAMYHWATFHELNITYTNAVAKGKRPKNKEVAITPATNP